MSDTDAANDNNETFEASLERLEEIVANLEDGSLGLNESLGEFEAGMSLLKRCHGMLETAEQRIEILTGLNKAGEERTESFDSAATFNGPTATKSTDSDGGADEENSEDTQTLF